MTGLVLNVLICLGVLLNFITSFNPRSVYEWWYDAHNLDVIEYLQQETGGDDVSLATHWMMRPGFRFYKYTGQAEGIDLYDDPIKLKKGPLPDYYYAFESQLDSMTNHYIQVRKFGWDRWLLERASE